MDLGFSGLVISEETARCWGLGTAAALNSFIPAVCWLGSVSPALGWRSVLSAHLQQSLLWTSLISQLVFSQSHQVSFKTLGHRLQTFFTRQPQQGSGVEKWPIFWVSRNSDEKWLLISDGGCAWHGLGTAVVFQNYGWPFCKMKKIVFNPMLTR